MDKITRRKAFLINAAYYLLILAILYALFKYGLPLIMPFVIAFVFASLLKPVIRLLVNKLRFRQGLAAVLVTLLFYSTVGVLITFLIIKLSSFLEGIFLQLPALYENTIEPALAGWLLTLQNLLDLPRSSAMAEILPRVIQALGEIVSNLSLKAVSAISGLATSLPSFLISTLITIISTFFITMDYPQLTAFIHRQLPERANKLLTDVKQGLGEAIVKYIKSYSIIMSITFAELTIGLLILGVKNAILIALVTAVFDVLPVLGVGGILIPWALVALIQKNFSLAIGLLIVYLVITVIRNIIEPRIVGSQVGIHPVATLMSMFVGAKLFGGVGLFALPITIVLLKKLNDDGKIDLFK